VLILDSTEVASQGRKFNVSDQEVEVVLGRSNAVTCVVQGGNPPPTVTLASGGVSFQDVVVRRNTRRDPKDWMSSPTHASNASLAWTPTVHHVGLPFSCSAGVVDPAAVRTSFVPIVSCSKLLENFNLYRQQAETPYRLKSVFIRTLKHSENIVPEIYSMPFNIVES